MVGHHNVVSRMTTIYLSDELWPWKKAAIFNVHAPTTHEIIRSKHVQCIANILWKFTYIERFHARDKPPYWLTETKDDLH